MSSPNQPPDRVDSQPQDGTQSREPAQPQGTAFANNLNHNTPPQTMRLANGPGSGHVLVSRERLSDDVRRSAGLGSLTATSPQSSEQRLEEARMRFDDLLADHQLFQEAIQAQTQQQRQQDPLRQEGTRMLDADLQHRRPPAFGQDAPLNSSQQLVQYGQPRCSMPALRSQPEFYMTGVTAVNTTVQPVADDAGCTICLEPLSDDVIKLQACGHMFHTVCAQSWFNESAPRTGSKRGTCPNCRHELYEPDPPYGRRGPPQNLDQPVIGHGQLHSIPAPNRELFSRREEARATTQLSESDRGSWFARNFLRPSVEAEVLQERPQQALAFPPQRQVTTRQILRGEPIRGDRRSHNVALEHVMNDAPAQEHAVDFSPRTSSLPHRGATRRQQAGQIMTDALRVNAASRNSHFEDEWVVSDALDYVSNVDRPSRTPSTPLEGPGAPTPTADRQPVQPHESRATIAERAIAQRRPLLLEPGLNNRDADLPQTVRRLAVGSHHTAADGNRDFIWVPDYQDHRQVIIPPPELTPTERAIRDLQHEQYLLLDRLREVQDQLGRHLQTADVSRERTTVVHRPAPNHFRGGIQDDPSTGRPPPIAIPRLADPAFPDLRSAREFPDRRAVGPGTSIWSADHVDPRESSNETQAPGRRTHILSIRFGNRETTESPARVTNSDDQIPLSPVSTYPAASSDRQNASADSSVQILGIRQQYREGLERLGREYEDIERLIQESRHLDQPLVSTPTDDNTPEVPQ